MHIKPPSFHAPKPAAPAPQPAKPAGDTPGDFAQLLKASQAEAPTAASPSGTAAAATRS